MVGIVDQALEAGGQDSLEISSYHEALVDFIKQTDTPMTIGVQGEWGSGKTSLLNQIWSKLHDSNNEHAHDEKYLQIWVNSWEHSLLCKPEECLLKIVNGCGTIDIFIILFKLNSSHSFGIFLTISFNLIMSS